MGTSVDLMGKIEGLKKSISLGKAAIIAGVAILMMTFAAVVATDLTIGKLILPGDAASSTDNVLASKMLFRVGLLSWLIILVCDVFAAWGLYVFLRPVSQDLSMVAAWFRLVYAAILGTALLNFTDILLLIKDETPLLVYGLEQYQYQVYLHLNGFYEMWSFGLMIFGIHIYFIGYLILKSDYVPKVFGILLLIAFLGYVSTNLIQLLLPEYEHFTVILEWIFIIPMLGEVGLGVWLLIKGKNVKIK